MQEEELSVSEILSSIRQVLSKEAEALDKKTTKSVPLKENKQNISNDEKEKTPVLELTPKMRVNTDSVLSASTALKTQAALEKLNQIKTMNNFDVEKDVKPYIISWLDAHLPDIVEKVVAEEVRRLISSK